MSDAIERLVNLALFFADARGTVTAEQARAEVAGYPADQDEGAFLRMFERDKDDLRQAGFTVIADEAGRYHLDRSATFSSPIDLDPREAAAVRAAGTALLGDPSFPFRSDLQLALAKVSAELDVSDTTAAACLADEDPQRQGEYVAIFSAASSAGKRVTFGYENSLGVSAEHAIEPYGLFLHDGRWYLVGRDTAKNEVRTYAVGRMTSPVVNPTAPRTSDFVRPEDFNVATFVRLPFQFGSDTEQFEATIRFDESAAWRASSLCAGHGSLKPDGDQLVWCVPARSHERLIRFVIENGPGLHVEGPAALLATMHAGLEKTEALHG